MTIFNPDTDSDNDKVSVLATSTSVKGVNRNRKFLILTNDSDETIYVALGSTAVMNKGIRLSSAGVGKITIGEEYTGAVSAICTSGSKNLCICEG